MRYARSCRWIAALFLLACGLTHQTQAQVPQRLAYQSLVTGLDGTLVDDGLYQITFRLYDKPHGGQALWTETQAVPVKDGLLSTLIGAEKALTLPFDKPYFLSIEIDHQPESERMALSAAAYALIARDVPDSTVVRSISGIQDNIELVAGDGITIEQQDHRLIISTHGTGLRSYGPAESPVAPKKATGPMTVDEMVQRTDEILATLGPGGSNTGLDLAYDGWRFVTLDDGEVVLKGTGAFPLGLQVLNADMLFRNNTGGSAAFRFRVDGSNPLQVWQIGLNGPSGSLRFINSTANTAPFKITKAAAHNLLALDAGGLTVNGNIGIGSIASGSPQEALHLGAGLNVRLDGGEIQTMGPLTFHPDVDNTGDDVVRFLNSTGDETLQITNGGNVGFTTAFFNVAFNVRDNGNNSGGIFQVEAENGTDILEVRNDQSIHTSGNLVVGGTLSKAGGSFKIDHPLDPEGQYLYHSFVESPDMMNVYNGNVVLDANGEATVELPDYFEALNRDFRYQLTAIGGPGPNLYVAEKIDGNRFRIAGGRAGLEVSWQVTGVRKDAWAEQNRIPVEERKAVQDQGFYLHPEAFGLPVDRRIRGAEETQEVASQTNDNQ